MRTSDVTQLMDLALGLWFPFVRIMAFLRYMPVLDNSALTARVRIILSLALAIIITPLIPHPIPHNLLSLNSLILTVEQILWGMLFGLMFQFLFLALQLAGQILSFNMGMSMAVMNDPSSGASTTVLAELINVYAILLFFCHGRASAAGKRVVQGLHLLADWQRPASANPAYHRAGL